MSTYSNEIWARAQTVMPGGVNSPVRAFGSVGGDPLFFHQGQGAYLFDFNNKRYVDFVCAWGPLILGHAHPRVIQAIQEAALKGLGFGAPHASEVEMAEKLTQIIPSIEKIRLVTSGTEATQTAIRLARGYTGRNKILKFEGCYHGHSDALLVKAGSGALTFGVPNSLGVPPAFAQYTLTLPFNDLAKTEALFKEIGQEIAAIIVEPVAGNMNCVLPLPEFLPGLRKLCDEYQTLLIFDEIITGFRVALKGAQSVFKVQPDLTCLGKIIGGGLPIAAFGGKKDIMDHLSPQGKVYQAGTLSGNPIALAAGLATLKELEERELETPSLYEILSQQTQYFCESLKQLARDFSIPLSTSTIGGMFGIFFCEKENFTCYEDVQKCNQDHFKQFFHGMLHEGVYLAPSAFEVGFISAAHKKDVLDFSLEAARKVFSTWKHMEI